MIDSEGKIAMLSEAPGSLTTQESCVVLITTASSEARKSDEAQDKAEIDTDVVSYDDIDFDVADAESEGEGDHDADVDVAAE